MKLFVIQCAWIAFQGDFRIRGKFKAGTDEIKSICNQRGVGEGRRSTAEKDREDAVFFPKARGGGMKYFLPEDGKITALHLRAKCRREKVAVQASGDTEWDVNIETGGYTRWLGHEILLPRQG